MKNILLLLVFLVFLSNCAERQVERQGVLLPYSKAAELELEQIERTFQNRPSSEYILALERFISDYEDTSATEKAKFDLAKVYYKKDDTEKSYQILKEIDQDRISTIDLTKVLYLLALNSKIRGLYLEATQWNLKLLSHLEAEDAKTEVKKETEILILKLDEEALNTLLSGYSTSYPASHLYLKKGKLFQASGHREEAVENFNKALEFSETDGEREKIRLLQAQLEKSFTTRKGVIGCILPLSGNYASFGVKSLKGIQQALGFFNPSEGGAYELAIFDSEGSPEKAAQGVEKLLEEKGVIAIIGPLLSASSEAAAIKAEEFQVPMINLSQQESITEKGEYVFRMAMTRRHQADALLKFACEKKGFKHFAILYPEDNYGIEFANLFWDKVEACGGTVEGAEVYQPEQNDFNTEVKKLVGLEWPKDRKEEYQLYEEKAKIDLNKEEVKESEVKLPPKIDFEALFIPDYAKTIGQIAPTLAYYDVEKVMLLGPQGWNSPLLLERADKYVEGAIFVDGFYKESENPNVQKFVKEFEGMFNYSPEIWEAQAYDASKLLVTLLEEKEIKDRQELKEALASLSDFKGVTGAATFGSNHDVEKDLFFLTVHNGKITSFLSDK